MKPNGKSTRKLNEFIEEHDTTKPIYEFSPGFSGHEWRQQGPYLVCNSCELKHATYVGINKLLVGISANGKPILEDR